MDKTKRFFLYINWLIIISLGGCHIVIPQPNSVSQTTSTPSPALTSFPAIASTPTTLLQTTPSSAGKIIFAAKMRELNLYEDSHIFISQANGAIDQIPQMFEPFEKAATRQIAISPGGRFIAFDGASEQYSCNPGSQTDCMADNYGLFLADLRQQKVVPIAPSGVPGRDTYSWKSGPPSWSPDASKFTFLQSDGLYQYELQTAKMQLVIENTPGMEEGFPSWSPDGQWIAFIRLPFDRQICPRGVWSGPACRIGSLWMVHPDGTGERKLLEDVYFEVPKDASGFYIIHDFPFSTPVWSPNSQWLALTTGKDQPDLTLVNIRTQEIRYLASHPAKDMHPDWSPDGKWLAFNSDRTGNEDIFLVSVDGSQLVNLTEHPANDYLPVWSPDGKQLAFLSTRDKSGYKLFIMMVVEGAEPWQVKLEYLQINGKPTWFPSSELP